VAHLTCCSLPRHDWRPDVVGDPRLKEEPLADVFTCIETHYTSGVSLEGVAAAWRSRGPTVVRCRSARTVLEWIVERRMAQARRPPVETDLTVEAVAARGRLRRCRLLSQVVPVRP
jgi:AraC family transcriptional activator of pobA